jgi:hypothetical protein
LNEQGIVVFFRHVRNETPVKEPKMHGQYGMTRLKFAANVAGTVPDAVKSSHVPGSCC